MEIEMYSETDKRRNSGYKNTPLSHMKKVYT